MTKSNTKRFWIAWSNTDVTEGRGLQYPFAISESRACAIRLGHKGSVMGSDCTVEPFDAPYIDGRYLFPALVHQSAREDDERDKRWTEKQKAKEAAKLAGLTNEQIEALSQ